MARSLTVDRDLGMQSTRDIWEKTEAELKEEGKGQGD